jgi:periplasmic protein TonB
MRAWMVLCVFVTVAAAAAQPRIFRVSDGVTIPRVIFKVEPEYSAEARAAKVDGKVLMKAVVDEEGRPTEIEALGWIPLREGDQELGLKAKAVEALAKWKFSPGRKDGVPVKVEVKVEMNFRLLNQPSR